MVSLLKGWSNTTRKVIRSKVEKELHRLLLESPLQAECKVQFPEGPYILDFFFPDWRLAVEVDGPWHDTEEGKEKDKRRDRALFEAGIPVLHLPSDLSVGTMREYIRDVAQQILYMGIPAKIECVQRYSDDLKRAKALRETPHQTPKIEPPTWDKENFLGNPACRECNGNGWITIKAWAEKIQRMSQVAVRCKCQNIRIEAEECTPIPPIVELMAKKSAQSVLNSRAKQKATHR